MASRIEKATQAAERGDTERAEQLAERHVEKNDPSPDAYVEYARVVGKRLGKLEKAGDSLGVAIDLSEESSATAIKARVMYGHLLMVQSREAKAYDQFRQVLDQDESHAGAHRGCTYSLYRAGDERGAKRHFQAARRNGDEFLAQYESFDSWVDDARERTADDDAGGLAACVPDTEEYRSPPRRNLDYEEDLAVDDDPLSTGGQATVFEARVTDATPPERVAVRLPHDDPSLSETVDFMAIDEFTSQIDQWIEIDNRSRDNSAWTHDTVVGVVDYSRNPPWLALEYMDGESLETVLERKPDGLELPRALWIAGRLCRGLLLAHSRGRAHMDVKPDNILFRETNAGTWNIPKIADWGTARPPVDDSRPNHHSGQYSAPEQSDPNADIDMLTDVYQLGAVVYALVTGDPPPTTAPDEDPPSLRAQQSEVPMALDTAVQWALETSRAERCKSVSEFKTELRPAVPDEVADALGYN